MFFDGNHKTLVADRNGVLEVVSKERYQSVEKWFVLSHLQCMLTIRGSQNESLYPQVSYVFPDSSKDKQIQCCHCFLRNYPDFIQVSSACTMLHRSFRLALNLVQENRSTTTKHCNCEFVIANGTKDMESIDGGDICAVDINDDAILLLDKVNPANPFHTLYFKGFFEQCTCCSAYGAQLWGWSDEEFDSSESDSSSDSNNYQHSSSDEGGQEMIPRGGYLTNLEYFHQFLETSYNVPGCLQQTPVYVKHLGIFISVGVSRINPAQEEVYVLDLNNRTKKIAVWSRLTHFCEDHVARKIIPNSTVLINFKFDTGWVCTSAMDLKIYLRYSTDDTVY